MPESKLPEVWLRGPVPQIPSLLQPVAHALLQAREEVNELMIGFPGEKLWLKPAGVASVGFHLQHISGVLDRLFTYAKGEHLTPGQLQFLSAEGLQPGYNITVAELVNHLNEQIEQTVNKLKDIKEDTLGEPRFVGRKQLPSSVLGLIFHAAEHTMRHVGQMLVTVRVIKESH